MNRLQLFRQLAIGLLPILVFMTADAIWGSMVGLAVATGSGLLELAWTWVAQKRFDGLILIDTLLVIGMGIGSLLLASPFLFELKPAVMDLFMAGFFGVAGFSRLDLMAMMMRRTLRGVELAPAQVAAMKRSSRILCGIFIFHALAVVFAAWRLPQGAWAFVAGPLLYLLIACWLAGEFVIGYRKKRRFAAADDEWFDLVDTEGRRIGRAPRRLCHSGPGRLHPVIHLHLLSDDGRLYLQKRAATKEIQPGKWDTAVGGHVSAGEAIEAALAREAREELGLTRFHARPLLRYVWQSAVESELVYVFLARGNFPDLTLDPVEVEDGRFWKIRKIRENLGRGVFTPNFEREFELIQMALTGN